MSDDANQNDGTKKNDDSPTEPRVKPRGKQQVKPGGGAKGGRVVLTEEDRQRHEPAHAGAAGGIPHDEHEAADLHDADGDSIDLLLGHTTDEALAALKTAGIVLGSVAAVAGIAALVVAGIREAREEGLGHRVAGAAGAARARGGLAFGRSRQIDLNRASLDRLQELPGVGRSTALLIVRHRPYESVSEARLITGMRASVYRELRPHAKV